MEKNQKKSVIVLGNGKSLADHPFHKYKVDTIGMNHAYRYWDRIKWYPTYYVTVDQEMSTYFAKDVYRMVRKRKKYGIKKFLLSKMILTKYPQLKKNKDVYFVEDLKKRGARGFKGIQQSTAGSISTRFGIFLGYQKVYILGVDANYQPFNIKWARKLINSKQRLKVTVDPEPTYFFVGYRSKGDYFHIPPKRRWQARPNHYRTFGVINRSFNKKNNLVVNANPDSMLHKQKMLPYEPLPKKFMPENVEELSLPLLRPPPKEETKKDESNDKPKKKKNTKTKNKKKKTKK